MIINVTRGTGSSESHFGVIALLSLFAGLFPLGCRNAGHDAPSVIYRYHSGGVGIKVEISATLMGNRSQDETIIALVDQLLESYPGGFVESDQMLPVDIGYEELSVHRRGKTVKIYFVPMGAAELEALSATARKERSLFGELRRELINSCTAQVLN